MIYGVEAIFSSFDDDFPERHVVYAFSVSSDDDFASSFSLALTDFLSSSCRFLSDDYGVPFFVKDIKCFINESEDWL